MHGHRMLSSEIDTCKAYTKLTYTVTRRSPSRFYFGRDIPDHKKIKMGLIRCLTYFGSAISDIHLETGKISLKTYFLDYD